MFKDWNKITTVQLILILVIVLVVENTVELYLQSTMKASVSNINRAHIIKHDHVIALNNPCDVMIKRYEKRAMSMAYKNFTTADLMGVVNKSLDDIPPEDIVYVKLKDGFVVPVAYFDNKGFLQTSFIPVED